MDIASLYQVYTTCSSVSTDTRQDPSGSLFFCLKGPNFDANTFALKALEMGATHVVADDPQLVGLDGITVVDDSLTCLQDLARHHRRQLSCPLIGLTGSNGKTTHKELIAAVLSQRYRTFYTKGNLNNHIGVPLSLLAIPLDAEMAVIEMGANHQGEIRDLSAICEPDVGLITNIGKAHLEGFGGLEGVRKGKGELFDFLRKRDKHLVFLNGDDEQLCDMARGMSAVLYGTQPGFYITGMISKSPEDGLAVTYRQGDFISPLIQTQLIGDYNLYNVLAAVCIGRYYDVPHEDIRSGLQNYRPSLNRSQLHKSDRNTLILDAYNANPSSMQLAIEDFAKAEASNKLLILGEMLELGTESKEEHRKVVELILDKGLQALLVGEAFEVLSPLPFPCFSDSEALKEYLEKEPVEGATILLKGSRRVALEKVVPVL